MLVMRDNIFKFYTHGHTHRHKFNGKTSSHLSFNLSLWSSSQQMRLLKWEESSDVREVFQSSFDSKSWSASGPYHDGENMSTCLQVFSTAPIVSCSRSACLCQNLSHVYSFLREWDANSLASYIEWKLHLFHHLISGGNEDEKRRRQKREGGRKRTITRVSVRVTTTSWSYDED